MPGRSTDDFVVLSTEPGTLAETHAPSDTVAAPPRAAVTLGGEAETVAGSDLDVVLTDPPPLVRGAAVGRYVVLGRLGAGGMGVVYAAYDPELDRKVALKLLRSDASGADARTRLLREAQALARLSHPHVVTVHDVGVDPRGVWLAMEHIDGVTLRTWLSGQRHGWREVLRVMRAVGAGLAAAHAAGLVHRDLKPENIMIGADGRVRVMDFGLARGAGELAPATERTPSIALRISTSALAEPLTRVGALLGTPAYMAPEQLRGEDADARADQFALCVTLWEALHGERPFTGEHLAALARHIRSGRPRPPPRRPRVPAWLRRALLRGLADDPAARYPSIDALLAALERGRSRMAARRGLLGLGALALAGALLLAGRRHAEAARAEACAAAGAEIAATWDDDARTRLRGALLATGAAQAAVTADRLMPWIDRWTAEWSRVRGDVCRAADLDGTLDADEHARARACLDERRDRLEVLLTVLGEGDASGVPRAVLAAAALPASTPCADPQFLARHPLAPGPLRAEVAARRRELARLESQAYTGRLGDAVARAERELAAAEATGHAPLVLAVRLLLGDLRRLVPDPPGAEAELRRVFRDAGALGDDELAGAAALLLVRVLAEDRVRPDEGLVWAEVAEVLQRRLGTADSLDGARLLHARATATSERDGAAAALPIYAEALAQRERLLGPDHPHVAQTLHSLGVNAQLRGALDEARARHERALDLRTRAFGPDHPDVALSLVALANVLSEAGETGLALAVHHQALTTLARDVRTAYLPSALVNLAIVHAQRGEHAAARDALARAAELHARTLGPDHPDTLDTVAQLAGAEAAAGFADAAVDAVDRALAGFTRTGGDRIDRAGQLHALARVLVDIDEPARAEALYRRVLDLVAAAPGDGAPLVAVLAELAALRHARGDPGEAVALLTRALAVDVPPARLAELRFALARALADAPAARGGDLPRALELAAAAAPVLGAPAEAWLRAHARQRRGRQAPGR
jgi:tetratricopeptide (TPR) repeat protein